MIEAPKFFVPEVADADKYQEVFEALAKHCGGEPPPADRRIYSITLCMTVRSGLPRSENVCVESGCPTHDQEVRNWRPHSRSLIKQL